MNFKFSIDQMGLVVFTIVLAFIGVGIIQSVRAHHSKSAQCTAQHGILVKMLNGNSVCVKAESVINLEKQK